MEISLNVAQFNAKKNKYESKNITKFDKSLIEQQTGQKFGSSISHEGLKALAKNFDKFDTNKNGLFNADELGKALNSGKIKDETAKKAAILLMTNDKLLNKLDDGKKDGKISRRLLEEKTGLEKGQNKFNAAVELFSGNSNVLDKFESGGRHGNDRFGMQAIDELAKAKTDDKAWNEGSLSKVTREDRQKYSDAAKVLLADKGRLGELAGDDGIMKNKDFKTYLKDHKTDQELK